MSQQADDPNRPHSMVIQLDTPPADPRPRQREADGGSDPRKDTQMNEGRVGGELEGSTFGSSSGGGERGGASRGQRKTQASSSFMLDSSFMPKSKSLRANDQQQQQQQQPRHRPRRSEPDRKEKRGPPEVDNNAGSRKKSRFPWSRQRHSPETRSPSEPVATGSRTSRKDPQSSNTAQLEERDEPKAPEEPDRASIGLDQDSIQIVNLALNLNESRKRGSLGRSASHRVSGGSWTVPAGQSSPHYGDSHTPATMGGSLGGHGRSQAHPSLTRSFVDDHSRPLDSSSKQSSTNEPWSVSRLLPNPIDDGSLPRDISESTFARVARTRRHFELVGEYLRLLPSLPPLRHRPASDDALGPSRTYNPLQTIRNRKVRYREKCPINAEVEGWHDVAAVHEWVNTVGQRYGQRPHTPLECFNLPPLRAGHSQTFEEEPDDVDLFDVASPPDSVKRARRSSSTKARRPRFDWIVSPAELLADVVWVEDDLNKCKLVDRDGNHLYPDPTELTFADASRDSSSLHPTSFSGKRVSLDAPSPASFADSHPPMSNDYKGIGRGRPRQRFQSPSSAVLSSSVSTQDRKLKQRRSRIRSRSSSSVSVGAGLSGRSRISSPISGRVMDPSYSKTKPTRGFESPSYQAKKSSAWASSEWKQASVSSAASTDDRHNRTSLDAMDSTAPNSPLHPGFFPSIAVNLSPQSSRSASPTKKPFPQRIVARHERNKSKHRAIEAREQGRDSLDSQYLRKRGAPGHPDASDRPGKLEPSPLPDQVSPSYQDDQADDPIPAGRVSGQHESKIRGLFKGKGKIAEMVGNEVSKVGDFILKKDHSAAHSRKSSFAASATSNDADAEAANHGKSSSAPRGFLRRLPTVSDDSGRTSRKNLENDASKAHTLSVPQNDQDEQRGASVVESPRESTCLARDRDTSEIRRETNGAAAGQQGKFDPEVSARKPKDQTFRNGLPLRIDQEQVHKKGQIRDLSVPFSLTRPPVTGLAQAEATPPSSAHFRRPTLSGSWTISDRSIPTLSDLEIPQKREIERTRALLLSSGIKAREITRRAETVRDPPESLQKAIEFSNSPIPQVTRLEEFDLAVQNLQRRFEKPKAQFQQSIDRFPAETATPLKSQLDNLENLVSRSLTPRIRAAASDAEGLSVQLNSTNTLALKQLGDTLDKGVRKRRRRLRWVSRAGFVMLEWALVGMLWWVWLIVMAFKVLRSVFRGAISGMRWVLWL